MDINKLSAIDVALEAIRIFLDKNNLFLVDKMDEITVLSKDVLDGKKERELTQIISSNLDNLEKAIKDAFNYINSSITLTEKQKIRLYFELKNTTPKITDYLEKEKVSC